MRYMLDATGLEHQLLLPSGPVHLDRIWFLLAVDLVLPILEFLVLPRLLVFGVEYRMAGMLVQAVPVGQVAEAVPAYLVQVVTIL
jgi:hypothetical protein